MNRAGLRLRPSQFDLGALAISLGVFAVPTIAAPKPGLDAGWMNALAMASSARMQWGRDVVFTYGPWGFLDVPLATSRIQVAVALLFNLFAYGMLFGVLRLSLGRGLPPRIAAVAASLSVGIVAGSTLSPSIILFSAFAGLLVLRLADDPSVMRWHWVAPLAGAAGGLTLNIKFIEGVALSVSALLVALIGPGKVVRDGWRTFAAIAGMFAFSWVAAGQAPTNIGLYLSTSVDVAQGYSEAMGVEGGAPLLAYVVAMLLAAAALGASYQAREGARGWRRFAPMALVIVVLVFGAKSGFTRHDQHDHQYFLIAGMLLCALLAGRSSTQLTASLACVALIFAGSSWTRFDPLAAKLAWASNLELLVNKGYQDSLLAAARTDAQAAYGVPPNVLAHAQGHPTHVDPWEVAAAWAYELPWHPVPVFQQYSAYTASLDQLNASALQSAPDDQRVLRGTPTAIDGRNPIWETPRYMLTLMCDYKPVAFSAQWLLLGKAAPHCARADARGKLTVVHDRPIMVPQAGPNEIMVASFVPTQQSLGARLFALAVKDYFPLGVTVSPTETYRLPRNLADGPLLVHVPSGVAWPQQFGGRLDYRSLTFSQDGTIQFHAIMVGG